NVPATTMAIDGFECCSSKARSRGPSWQITSRTRQAPPSAITRLQSWPAQCACTWSAEAELDLTAIFAKTPSSQNDTTSVEAPESRQARAPKHYLEAENGIERCSAGNDFHEAYQPLGAGLPEAHRSGRRIPRRQVRLEPGGRHTHRSRRAQARGVLELLCCGNSPRSQGRRFGQCSSEREVRHQEADYQ